MRQDLDDPNKKCVLLLASDAVESEDEDAAEAEDLPSLLPFVGRDLPEGYELRLHEYRKAWSRCLNRVQSLVRSLHHPVVEAVCSSVRAAHSDHCALPGLPFPELPVVAVSAPGAGGSIISEVVASLEHPKSTAGPPCIVSHVSAADCPNLTVAMKSIIGSFVARSDDEDRKEADIQFPPAVRRRATTSLASYDMNLLKAWYSALAALNEWRPPLVIVMNVFEQFDSTVLDGIFNICSQFVADIPLVFLLSMSAPAPSGFLRAALPRRTLQLLRLHSHAAPLGRDVVESVMEETFFDLVWTPNIMLGSGAFSFIADFSERQTASLDALTSVLHLLYLRHIEEPFTVLVHDSLLGCSSAEEAYEKLQSHRCRSFMEALQEQLDIASDDPAELLSVVDDARVEFAEAARQTRLAYRILRLLQDFMTSYGYRPTPYTTEDGTNESRLSFMTRVAQGKVTKDVHHLIRMVSKLRRDQLDTLFERLYKFFSDIEAPQLRHAESESREFIAQCRNRLPPHRDPVNGDVHSNGDARAAVVEVAVDLAEWLSAYLLQRLDPLDRHLLSEVWFTGSSSFPSELINPAPRPAIVHALLHPLTVLASHQRLFDASEHASAQEEERSAIWDLPDTSILFHRYMEAPKKVNAYDWFESFAQVLETQRERARVQAREEEKSKSRSKAAKRAGKSPKKDREKQRQDEERQVAEDAEVKGEEEDEEAWHIELHARFIRALHELDYIGLIKHTGRKADHIVKTIYDVYE